MHVTRFSAATFLVFATASPLRAQGIEVFGGYSVNADYVQNRPAILVVDQKVSPFFSLGSGPTGFEGSFKREVWNGLGIKGDVSGYSDTFSPGPAAYCQPDSSSSGIACGTGLTFQATGRACYVTVGPEWKIRRGKRFAPFAEALVGIVSTRSTFMMSGSDVQYTNPFTGGVLLFTSGGFPPDRRLHYADAYADVGLALTIGGGFDIRVGKRIGLRTALDYDPTFLVRPAFPDLTPDAQGRVALRPASNERQRQDHVRLSIGMVWHIRSGQARWSATSTTSSRGVSRSRGPANTPLRPAELGRDHGVTAIWFERLADQFFVGPRSIYFRGIEERDPAFNGSA
jgi:hypothetical protein